MDRRRLSACANFVGYTDATGRYITPNNTDQRRLSDGPSLRLPNYNLHYPGEYGGSESCMFKQKNSSLTMLLDSTNSLMRTASTTINTIFGANRRASFCGEPDPTIQLSPSGNSGSLYLLPNSNESSLSNLSNEEQRRTVTIYDGRIPTAPSAPAIPFELMTPLDVITQAVDDPVESFVQIVLEEPDDRPPIIPPLSSSRRSSPSRHRDRNGSRRSSLFNEQALHSDQTLSSTTAMTTTSSLITELFNSSEVYCQPPVVVEPMDFSFLEPVLRGQSAAPPPIRAQTSRTIESCPPPTRTIMITEDDSSSSSTNDHHHQDSLINSTTILSRLKVPSSMD